MSVASKYGRRKFFRLRNATFSVVVSRVTGVTDETSTHINKRYKYTNKNNEAESPFHAPGRVVEIKKHRPKREQHQVHTMCATQEQGGSRLISTRGRVSSSSVGQEMSCPAMSCGGVEMTV